MAVVITNITYFIYVPGVPTSFRHLELVGTPCNTKYLKHVYFLNVSKNISLFFMINKIPPICPSIVIEFGISSRINRFIAPRHFRRFVHFKCALKCTDDVRIMELNDQRLFLVIQFLSVTQNTTLFEKSNFCPKIQF